MENQTTPLHPFSCSYSPQLPELLLSLNCSLVFSTYQAGKVVAVSALDNEHLSILPRSFEKAMGIGIEGDNMVIACKDEVIKLKNSKELAVHYPNKPDKYDSLYMPRATYFTGQVDIHDIEISGNDIWAVNTTFSCLVKVDDNYSFTPVWKPYFVSDLAGEDRCHLNGMVLENGKPAYVTALGKTNTLQGWRNNIVEGGLLMNVQTNNIIAEKLAMPHSPQMYKGELYLLQSATGMLVKVNTENGALETICDTQGFCRGMSIHKDYVFVGMSKLRKNSSTFAKLDFADQATFAGIKVYHLPTKAYVGEIKFNTSVDEIYAVKILPDTIKPNILNTINDVYKYALDIPGKTFWAPSGL